MELVSMFYEEPMKRVLQLMEFVSDGATASTSKCFLLGKVPEDSDDDEEKADEQEAQNDSTNMDTLDSSEEEITAAIAAASAPPVNDLLIAHEGINEEHFVISTSRMFVESQLRDVNLQLLRH